MNDREVMLSDLAQLTLKEHGEEEQLWIIIEEMGELAQSISHFRRSRCNDYHVAKEISDVMCCLFQLSKIIGVDIVKRVLDQTIRENFEKLGVDYMSAIEDDLL